MCFSHVHVKSWPKPKGLWGWGGTSSLGSAAEIWSGKSPAAQILHARLIPRLGWAWFCTPYPAVQITKMTQAAMSLIYLLKQCLSFSCLWLTTVWRLYRLWESVRRNHYIDIAFLWTLASFSKTMPSVRPGQTNFKLGSLLCAFLCEQKDKFS